MTKSALFEHIRFLTEKKVIVGNGTVHTPFYLNKTRVINDSFPWFADWFSVNIDLDCRPNLVADIRMQETIDALQKTLGSLDFVMFEHCDGVYNPETTKIMNPGGIVMFAFWVENDDFDLKQYSNGFRQLILVNGQASILAVSPGVNLKVSPIVDDCSWAKSELKDTIIMELKKEPVPNVNGSAKLHH